MLPVIKDRLSGKRAHYTTSVGEDSDLYRPALRANQCISRNIRGMVCQPTSGISFYSMAIGGKCLSLGRNLVITNLKITLCTITKPLVEKTSKEGRPRMGFGLIDTPSRGMSLPYEIPIMTVLASRQTHHVALSRLGERFALPGRDMCTYRRLQNLCSLTAIVVPTFGSHSFSFDNESARL